MEFLLKLGGILLLFLVIIVTYCNIKATDEVEYYGKDVDVGRDILRIFKYYFIGIIVIYLVIFIQTTSYIDVDVKTNSISMVGNGDFLVDIDGEHYLIDNDDVSLNSVSNVGDESITYHIIAYKENPLSRSLGFDDIAEYFNMPNTSDESTISVSDLEKQYKSINVSRETLEDFLKEK